MNNSPLPNYQPIMNPSLARENTEKLPLKVMEVKKPMEVLSNLGKKIMTRNEAGEGSLVKKFLGSQKS